MDEEIRRYWASVLCNKEFICVETYSGYGMRRRDPKGKQILLSPDASDVELGEAVLDALAHSRWALSEPREGRSYHKDVEFDIELHDYQLNIERYAAWIKDLMQRYAYKTKRALFKDMKNVSVTKKLGKISFHPTRHEKLEAWGSRPLDKLEDVEIPENSSAAEIGAAARLAFSRCIG